MTYLANHLSLKQLTAAVALSLFSSSCTSSQLPCWQSDQINSPLFSCPLSQKRINIGPQFLPIEVEVVDGPTGRQVYLNGTNLIFPKASAHLEGEEGGGRDGSSGS